MSLKIIHIPVFLFITGCIMSNPNDLIGETDRPLEDDQMFNDDELDNVQEDGGVGTSEPSTLEVAPDSIEISEEDMPPTDPDLPLSLHMEDDTLQVEHVFEWDDSLLKR